MAYEVFGFSFGDVAAIVALVFSGFTFMVGSIRWSRSKKSEEIKTARELMDRVIAKYDKWRYDYDKVHSDLEMSLDAVTDVLEEIDYYGLLVKNELIKDFELLQHDRIEVIDIWKNLFFDGGKICDSLARSNEDEYWINKKIKIYNDLIKSTKKYWKPGETDEIF